MLISERIIYFTYYEDVFEKSLELQAKTNGQKTLTGKEELEYLIKRSTQVYKQFYRFIELNERPNVYNFYKETDEEQIRRKIKEKTDVKILGGILPVVSYRNAVFLNNELPGVTIPKEFINRFTADMTKEEGQAVGVDIAVSMGKKLKDICDGLYFITPFGRTNMIVDIVNKINEA